MHALKMLQLEILREFPILMKSFGFCKFNRLYFKFMSKKSIWMEYNHFKKNPYQLHSMPLKSSTIVKFDGKLRFEYQNCCYLVRLLCCSVLICFVLIFPTSSSIINSSHQTKKSKNMTNHHWRLISSKFLLPSKHKKFILSKNFKF